MIRVVVFDAYGTLFGALSFEILCDALYPGQGQAIAAMWRDKQIEYTRIITMSDPLNGEGSRYYEDYWELTRLALRYTLSRLKLPSIPAHEDQLMGQFARLKAFPESFSVLKELKAMGMQTAVLSDACDDMLECAVANAGFAELLSKTISADSVRAYKTSPKTYGLVLSTFSVLADEVLYVSSHGWDVLGGTWFGFMTLWVNRQSLPLETLGPKPNFVGTDLSRVLEIVSSQSAQ